MYTEIDTIADDEREYEVKPSSYPNEYCLWRPIQEAPILNAACGLKITDKELFDNLEGYRTICCPRCRKPIKFMKG